MVITVKYEKDKKYDLIYDGQKVKKNKNISLKDESYILLKEHRILSNKFMVVFFWIIQIFVWIFSIILLWIGIDLKKPKTLKKIQINYHKVLDNEIVIEFIDKRVNVYGLEIESIVINGLKQEIQNNLSCELNINQ